MKLRENGGENKVTQKTKELLDAMKVEKDEKDKAALKKVAEKFIEDIFLGTKQPVHGMKINIELKGPFTLFGLTTTEGSSFKYVYPSADGAKPPEIEPKEPEEPTESSEELFP